MLLSRPRVFSPFYRLFHTSRPTACSPEFIDASEEEDTSGARRPLAPKWALDPRGEEIRTAKARRLGINVSHRKLDLVARLVRNLRVEEARRQLIGCKKKSAPLVMATIHAAVVNARVFNLREDRLIINEAYVGQGRYLPRIRPWHGKGRFGVEHKKYAHLTIILRELDEELWESRVMTRYVHFQRGKGRPVDEDHLVHFSNQVKWVSDLDDSFRKTRENVAGLKALLAEKKNDPSPQSI